jgi:tRNA A64-2'-O-ribosylphosphate transferase
MPDALAKTIPIWCVVINRAVRKKRFQLRGESETEDCNNGWDTQLYTSSRVIAPSEHRSIEARLEDFVQKLLVRLILLIYTLFL